MSMDRKYLVWSLAYVAVGMGLGIYQAATHNHAQYDTHAHVLLVGFAISFLYAVIHRLWLGEQVAWLARTQFVLHQAGAVVMSAGLFMMYGSFAPAAQLAPILGLSSIAVFIAALMMIFMVLRQPKH
jgi:hypothetical protein